MENFRRNVQNIPLIATFHLSMRFDIIKRQQQEMLRDTRQSSR